MTSERSKWKSDVIFGFSTPKNLCFDIHGAKKYTLNFDLSHEVRGQCRWPPRGQTDKKGIFYPFWKYHALLERNDQNMFQKAVEYEKLR